ncbi:MAG: hypothetical protein IKE70_05525, partial [Bacilli bacterium]|nr:hypothetical protein [Bacilli bacterium]
MNGEVIWTKLLNQLKDEMTSLSFDTWFSETELYKLDQGKAYIIVPMPIHKKHLKDNYDSIITNKLQEFTSSYYELVFLLKEEVEKEQEKQIITSPELNAPTKINNDTVHNNLNGKYLFENFIVGNSNKFAQ